jgi:RNA polymerase sigma factor (sigma-70 family)
VEGYTLRQQPLAAMRGPSPLLKLAGDERLIALTRAGQQAAFEALVSRYQARLLAFIRHMVRSREDAEDVLQEVFAAAFNAIMADTREINARPWLYRIARNRALNHLRRATAVGMDDMDAHFADAGQSTSEKVHRREEFRLLLEDISHLPETQRSALVLREMDALSYEQIADVMDTTVPSVKSLLVRARIGLAEAAEARKLTCGEVRVELGGAAEGLGSPSPAVRRHVKGCERCRSFRTQLRSNNRALAAILPIGPLILLKKTLLFKLGLAKLAGGGGAATATAGAGGGTAAAAAGGSAAVSAGGIAAGAVAIKAAAVVAVAVVAVGTTTNVFHTKPHHVAATAALVTATPTVPAAPAAQLIDQRAKTATLDSLAGRHPYRPLLRHLPRHVGRTAPWAILPIAGTTTAPPSVTAVTPTAVVTPPVSSTPTVNEVAATPPPVTPPPSTATPTTQEITTTTVFPGSGSGTTGTSGTGVATGTTGAAGSVSTGSTGATGSTTTTGSTGTVSTSSTYPSSSGGSSNPPSTFPSSTGGSASPGQGGPSTTSGSSAQTNPAG